MKKSSNLNNQNNFHFCLITFNQKTKVKNNFLEYYKLYLYLKKYFLKKDQFCFKSQQCMLSL